MTDLDAIAARLDEAALTATPVAQLTEPLTLDEAYDVQARLLARRYRRGERAIGIKMGFTSRAKMAQMGVNDLIWGRLTDRMLHASGDTISRRAFVHPRAEPEIAFRLKSPLSGRVDAATALAAVAAVAPAVEIIDSRYRDFRFSLTDVVADNSSSSALVIGSWVEPTVDLAALAMQLVVDGEVRQRGSSAAILGHPLESLVNAARLVAERGETLRAGDIVMAGAATAAEPLSPGLEVRADVEKLGSVSFRVGD
jgi:2-oxo-3-hexenedioate decarboxylase